jgi:hypothetical protein
VIEDEPSEPPEPVPAIELGVLADIDPAQPEFAGGGTRTDRRTGGRLPSHRLFTPMRG